MAAHSDLRHWVLKDDLWISPWRIWQTGSYPWASPLNSTKYILKHDNQKQNIADNFLLSIVHKLPGLAVFQGVEVLLLLKSLWILKDHLH